MFVCIEKHYIKEIYYYSLGFKNHKGLFVLRDSIHNGVIWNINENHPALQMGFYVLWTTDRETLFGVIESDSIYWTLTIISFNFYCVKYSNVIETLAVLYLYLGVNSFPKKLSPLVQPNVHGFQPRYSNDRF